MATKENPFQIGIDKNEAIGCFDMTLQVGNLTEREAQQLAEAISDWLTNESGWKARVQ